MRTELTDALKALQMPPEELLVVRSTQYRAILDRILETFTVYGSQGRDRLWLWEGFKGEQQVVNLHQPAGHRELCTLVPADQRVWLLTEDWGRQKRDGHYWLFEGRVSTIAAVLNELFAFEYYIVDKDFEWLLCETHHNVLIGVGSYITERLRTSSFTAQASVLKKDDN